jgi:hypothetical protein
MSAPTVQLSGTVTIGKTRELLNVTATEAGSKSIEFTNEAEAVTLSLNIVSNGMGTHYMEVYWVAGDSNDHEVRLLQTPSSGSLGVTQYTLPNTGRLRVEIVYTAQTTFELTATGRPGIVANTSFDVNVQETQADRMFKDRLLMCLDNIVDRLERIVNHQRQISGVEDNKGNKY